MCIFKRTCDKSAEPKNTTEQLHNLEPRRRTKSWFDPHGQSEKRDQLLQKPKSNLTLLAGSDILTYCPKSIFLIYISGGKHHLTLHVYNPDALNHMAIKMIAFAVARKPEPTLTCLFLSSVIRWIWIFFLPMTLCSWRDNCWSQSTGESASRK